MNHVKIEMTGHGRGAVFADGVEISGITAIEFRTRAGETNQLTLTFMPKTVEVTGIADVTERHAVLTKTQDG